MQPSNVRVSQLRCCVHARQVQPLSARARGALPLAKSSTGRSAGRREPLRRGEADVARGAACRRSRCQTPSSRIEIEQKEPPKGALQAWGLLWFLGTWHRPRSGAPECVFDLFIPGLRLRRLLRGLKIPDRCGLFPHVQPCGPHLVVICVHLCLSAVPLPFLML